MCRRTFPWDRTDGAAGAAADEFVPRGYDLEESVGLTVDANRIAPHPRENREVEVRALDPAPGADAELWEAVVELQVASRDEGHGEVVDTALAHRRRGICSRLVVEAARHSAEAYGAERFVLVADRGYHALGLYESLGFEQRERVVGVCLWQREE